MPKIDIDAAPTSAGSDYPPPHDAPCQGRHRWRLGDAAGLTQFGANLLRLAAGQWSSQRHWHSAEDELVYIVSGEVVLVDDAGETVLRAGDFAGFKCGVVNGHHLQNRTDCEAVILEIGSRRPEADVVDYPDIDLVSAAGEDGYRHRNGMAY